MNINFLLEWSPYGLVILAIAISFGMALVNKRFGNPEKVKEHQEKMKGMQKKVKELQNNPAELKKVQSEMMKGFGETMKYSFKPMLITMVPLLLIFTWLRRYYTSIGNPPLIFGLKWIWVYILSSLITSIIFNKILNKSKKVKE